MRIEALAREKIGDFVDYCRKHKAEIDESYLRDEDLSDFEPSGQNPTYIAVDDDGQVMAAASLIIDDYHRRGRRGRFRIFHAVTGDLASLQVLLHAVLGHTDGLDKVIAFVPLANGELARCMEELKFNVERYSFVLLRDDLDVPDSHLPAGYEICPFRGGRDETSWCEVRNAAFAALQGSETPITPEIVAKVMSGDDQIEGASLILFHQKRAVGVIRGAVDDYQGSPIMSIGPLAILPEYQGRGLGRSLLRALLRFAQESSYPKTILSVNAENDRAKALYIQEGFRQVEAVACWKYDIS